MSLELTLKAIEDELQIVYGEVYLSEIPDAHNDFMSKEEVRDMAYDFARAGKLNQVDTNHDNVLNGSYVVEMFIAREDDSIFIPGSWVVGMKVPDPKLWADIKSGKINGFSMEAMVRTQEVDIELVVPEVIIGSTEADSSDHVHSFEVVMDDDAKISGRTNIVNGHYHLIFTATVTGEAIGEEDLHTHRFSINEEIARVN